MTPLDAHGYLRFRLSTALVAFVIISLALGWFVDHRRQRVLIEDYRLENQIYERQVEAIKLERRHYRGQTAGLFPVFYWANANEFIEALLSISDDDEFTEKAPSLAVSSEETLKECVPLLLELVSSPERRTQTRAFESLRFFQELHPEQMEPYAESIVEALVPLLESDSEWTKSHAMGVLEEYGPASRPALESLHRIMMDDEDWYAPYAARAIAEIDPTAELGPRLLEMLEGEHPNWYAVAFQIPHHLNPEQAREALVKLHERLSSAKDKENIVVLLNQIEPD